MRNAHTSPVRRAASVAAAAVVAVLAALVLPSPAGAQAAVDARDAALSSSASCSQGDIELTYTAQGVERQLTQFTAEGGRELHRYDVRVYATEHDGVEYILSQTSQPPAAGTLVAVHVTIGSSPPDASSGEFFVAYRCDTRTNEEGGTNQVVFVCAGPFGTCPTSAAEYLARQAPASGPRPAVPVVATPTFTG